MDNLLGCMEGSPSFPSRRFCYCIESIGSSLSLRFSEASPRHPKQRPTPYAAVGSFGATVFRGIPIRGCLSCLAACFDVLPWSELPLVRLTPHTVLRQNWACKEFPFRPFQRQLLSGEVRRNTHATVLADQILHLTFCEGFLSIARENMHVFSFP